MLGATADGHVTDAYPDIESVGFVRYQSPGMVEVEGVQNSSAPGDFRHAKIILRVAVVF